MIAATHNFIQVNVVPQLKLCLEKLIELADSVFEVAKRAFAYLVENFPVKAIQDGVIETLKFFCCCPEEGSHVRIRYRNDRQAHQFKNQHQPRLNPNPNPWPAANNDELNPVRPLENISDASISHMNVDDFIACCKEYPVGYKIFLNGAVIQEGIADDTREIHSIFEQEKKRVNQDLRLQIDFPKERTEIGGLAKRWAEERVVKADPTSPFYEIIRLAVKQERGPNVDDSRIQSYLVPKNNSYYAITSKGLYTIYSLIGFQELSNPKNIELFYLLDNCSLGFSGNSAYMFATALSRIYTYPRAEGEGMDIRYKLQIGLGAALEAYKLAKEQDCINEFFLECFRNDNCFDARVSRFQEFSAEKMDVNFYAKVIPSNSIDVKVTRHVEAFRNRQIKLYVEDHPEVGSYRDFKAQVIREENIEVFEQEYYTKNRFAAYLEEEGQPIRYLAEMNYNLPRNHSIRFSSQKDFLTLDEWNLYYFPVEDRVVGKELALRDEDYVWRKVTVHRVGPKSVILDLRGNPVDRTEWERTLVQCGIYLT